MVSFDFSVTTGPFFCEGLGFQFFLTFSVNRFPSLARFAPLKAVFLSRQPIFRE